MCLGIFPIHCFLRDNSPKIELLVILLLYARGTFTRLIDAFVEFMKKESVLFMSDACSEINFRVETSHTLISKRCSAS